MVNEDDVVDLLCLTPEARAAELGTKVDPYHAQAGLYNEATSLLALMDQYDVEYDSDGRLETELSMFAHRIVDDVMHDLNSEVDD